jgi:hypothetical protein
MEIPVTALSDFAPATLVTLVAAVAVADWALRIEPSAGYANALPATGVAFGGETAIGVVIGGVPGRVILIAQAVAEAVGVIAASWAPAEPKTSRSSGTAKTRRRTRPDSARGS